MKPRHGVIVQIAAGVVMTIVLLAAIEVVSAWFVPAKPAKVDPAGDTVANTLAWLDINPAPLTADPDLLWRNAPGARKSEPVNPRPYGTENVWRIETNSMGFRGAELAADGRGDDVYRVLCVGDSITYGYNVDQTASYPYRLGELLRERFPDRRFEVINAGVPGWSWLQGLRFLEVEGLSLAPDAVVMGHGTNDQLFPAKVTDEERFHRLGGRVAHAVHVVRTYASRTNTYNALQALLPRAEWQPDQDSPGCLAQKRFGGPCRRVSLDEIERAVREVRKLTVEEGIDLLVANLDFIETQAVQAVRRATEAEGIPFVDTVAAVGALRTQEEERRARKLGLAPAAVAAAPAAAVTPKSVLLRVHAPAAAAAYTAQGRSFLNKPDFSFSEPVFDDGTHGDERASDGVYSVTLEVPADLYALEYKFYLGDVAEFTGLPPLGSSFGSRLLKVPRDTIGPVDVFGKSPFMAERAHPDADGQRIVADVIAKRLEELPSFRRFVGSLDTARRKTDDPD